MHYSEYEGIELTTMADWSSGGGVIGVERPVTCNLPASPGDSSEREVLIDLFFFLKKYVNFRKYLVDKFSSEEKYRALHEEHYKILNRLFDLLDASPGVIARSKVLDKDQYTGALLRVFSSSEATPERKIKWINKEPLLLCWAAVAAEKGNPAMANALAPIFQLVMRSEDGIQKIQAWIDKEPLVLRWAAVAAVKGNPAMANALAPILRLVSIKKLKAWIDKEPWVLRWAAEAAVEGNPAMANALAPILRLVSIKKLKAWIDKEPWVLSWAAEAAVKGNPAMANALAPILHVFAGSTSGDIQKVQAWINRQTYVLGWAAKAAEKGSPAMADALAPIFQLVMRSEDGIQKIQAWIDKEPLVLNSAAISAVKGNPAMANALAPVFSLDAIEPVKKIEWIDKNPNLLMCAAEADVEGNPAMANALAPIFQLVMRYEDGIQKIQAWIDAEPLVLSSAAISAVKGNSAMANALAPVFSLDAIEPVKKIEWIDKNPEILGWAAEAAEKGNPAMASALEQVFLSDKVPLDVRQEWINKYPRVLCSAAQAAAQGNPAMANALASILQLIANPTHAVDTTNATDGVQKIKAWIDAKPEVLCHAVEAEKKGNPAMMNALVLVFSSAEIDLGAKKEMVNKAYKDYVNSAVYAFHEKQMPLTLAQSSILAARRVNEVGARNPYVFFQKKLEYYFDSVLLGSMEIMCKESIEEKYLPFAQHEHDKRFGLVCR